MSDPRQPSSPAPPPQHARRPALKYNHDLAARFGIDPEAPTERETIGGDLASLPDPPGVGLLASTQAASVGPATPVRVTEDAIVHVIAEEMDELAARLSVYGIDFPTAARQQMVDTAMALLAGVRPGGALSGR